MRALTLQAHGLIRSRDRRPTRRSLQREIEALGFVQVDAIQVLERAHHLILRARCRGYRPVHLKRLLEEDRSLFEHWTHDAAVIPTSFLPWWTYRFAEFAERRRARMARRAKRARDFEALLRDVRQRIEREGPLRSSAFETPPDHPAGSFWNWKPAKLALEYLWRTGELAISGRDGFHKQYDLFERVHPKRAACPPLSLEAYLDWAIPEALERLGVATPAELAGFWGGISANQAKTWCRQALTEGRLVEVETFQGDAERPALAVALPDLPRRIARLREPADEVRLLCPFDPLIRDRVRAARLFGFDYRFEGFVPAAKRRHGYYVMAILDGGELVGRFDPRLDRSDHVLEVRRLRWERGQRTPARRERLQVALDELAVDLGADRVRHRRDG